MMPLKKMPDNPDDGLIFQDQTWAKEFIDQVPMGDFAKKIKFFTGDKAGLQAKQPSKHGPRKMAMNTALDLLKLKNYNFAR